MKISLSKELLRSFKNISFRTLIKILKIDKKNSLISVKGKSITIPFVLKKDTVYHAKFSNGILELIEQNKEQTEKVISKALLKNIRKDLKKLDSFFFFDPKDNQSIESEIKNYPFYDLFKKIKNNEDQKGKKKYFSLKKKDGQDHFFIFNMPFYNEPARVFMKINEKDIYLNLLSSVSKDLDQNKVMNELKDSIKNRTKRIMIKLSNKKEDFLDNITVQLKDKNIDIEV